MRSLEVSSETRALSSQPPGVAICTRSHIESCESPGGDRAASSSAAPGAPALHGGRPRRLRRQRGNELTTPCSHPKAQKKPCRGKTLRAKQGDGFCRWHLVYDHQQRPLSCWKALRRRSHDGDSRNSEPGGGAAAPRTASQARHQGHSQQVQHCTCQAEAANSWMFEAR